MRIKQMKKVFIVLFSAVILGVGCMSVVFTADTRTADAAEIEVSGGQPVEVLSYTDVFRSYYD